MLYVISLILLLLYSFTQIDLGLAMTRYPLFFSIQRAFQTIGYFYRPYSAAIYISIITLLSFSYFFLLTALNKHYISNKAFWRLVFLTGIILVFSYNAFSHDLFNYIFDAKIFTYYGKNPYLYKALDFPSDPMLAFMHWTHRTYPYGPIWLAISIALSYIGMNFFILNFILFKFIAAVSYVGLVYVIKKIAEKTSAKQVMLVSGFFAFNPLVIIETLVSAHHDSLMMLLAIISMYFLLHKKYPSSILFLFLSIGIKFATVFLLPVLMAVVIIQYLKAKVPWSMVFTVFLASLMLAVFAASQSSGNFQPWYLLFLMPFLALVSVNPFMMIGGIIASIGALLTYLPYLYLGNWDAPVPGILHKLYVTVLIVILAANLGYFYILKKEVRVRG